MHPERARQPGGDGLATLARRADQVDPGRDRQLRRGQPAREPRRQVMVGGHQGRLRQRLDQPAQALVEAVVPEQVVDQPGVEPERPARGGQALVAGDEHPEAMHRRGRQVESGHLGDGVVEQRGDQARRRRHHAWVVVDGGEPRPHSRVQLGGKRQHDRLRLDVAEPDGAAQRRQGGGRPECLELAVEVMQPLPVRVDGRHLVPAPIGAGSPAPGEVVLGGELDQVQERLQVGVVDLLPSGRPGGAHEVTSKLAGSMLSAPLTRTLTG